MNFFDHLDELRMRIFRCFWVFIAGFLVCYFYVNKWVFETLQAPLFDLLPPEQRKLYFTSLFENFMTHLKIAGYGSIFIFSPFYFYQLWAFIAPGLYPKERKMVLPFVGSATFFFVGGAAFAYQVLLPYALKFFVLDFPSQSEAALLTVGNYYDTVLKLMLLFGAAFELPVLVVLLGVMGIVDAQFLRERRRFVIIGITVACAMFAPPDAISMLILMIPLILLFEAAILVVAVIGKRRKAASFGDSGSSPALPDRNPNP